MLASLKSKLNFFLAFSLQSSTVILIALANAYINVVLLTEFPKTWIPYYYFIGSFVIALVALFLVPYLVKSSSKKVFVIEFICGLIISFFIVAKGYHFYALNVFIIYILLIITMIFSVTSWNVTALLFDVHSFKNMAKWFSIINSLCAGIIGILIFFFLEKEHSDNIILYFLNIFTFISSLSLLSIKVKPYEQTTQVIKSSPFRYPVYVKLAFFYILTALSFALIDYSFKIQLSHFSRPFIARYATLFYVLINILSAGIQLYSSKILLKVGLTGLFISLPLLSLLALIPAFIWPNLIFITILSITFMTIYYSYIVLGQQIIFRVLPNIIAKKGRFYFKAYVFPAGTLMGSLILAIAHYKYGFNLYGSIFFIIILLLFYLAFAIKKDYSLTLFKAVAQKRFESIFQNPAIKQKMIEALLPDFFSNKVPQQILFGFSLLKIAPALPLPNNLIELISNANAKVRQVAIRHSSLLNSIRNLNKHLIRQLYVETEPEVIWEIFKILLIKEPEFIHKNLKNFLVDKKPIYRAVALIFLINHGQLPYLNILFLLLSKMLNSEEHEEKIWAIRVISYMPLGDFNNELSTLLSNKNSRVVIETIKTCSRLKKFDLIPKIIEQLGHPKLNHAIYNYSFKAGLIALPFLTKACKKMRIYQTKHLLKIISAIDTEETEFYLIQLLKLKNIYFQQELAKQLAFRAINKKSSKNLLKMVRQKIYKELNYLKKLNYFIKIPKPDFQQHEFLLRQHMHESTLFYYLAAFTNPEQVLKLQANLFNELDFHMSSSGNAIALDYLDTIIKDRKLAQVFFKIFNPKETKTTAIKSYTIKQLKDDWLQTIINFNTKNNESSPMNSIEKIMILRAVDIFKQLPAEILLFIAEEFNIHDMAKNEIIFHEKEQVNGLYILISGSINLYFKNKLIKQVDKYECLSIFALLDKLPRPLTAKATEDGAYLFLEKQIFDRLIENHPEILFEISKHIINKYRNLLEIIAKEDMQDFEI